ncbi:MAG: DUF4258 domain-containing protein [Spirochaetes bacterium]|nr:DUF4258 domain-containing protein [Spirochaetota bacterium]
MNFKEIKYSGHAIQRMFERGVQTSDVENAVRSWNVITSYNDDEPYPSYLLLGFIGPKPLHVVAGIDEKNDICYIITVYPPDPELWTDGFTRRKQ